MDPSLVSAQTNTFQVKFQEIMYYLGPIAQVLYWLGMLLFVGYAVWQYKRYVNYKLGVGKSGQLKADKTTDNAVKVEEFVE